MQEGWRDMGEGDELEAKRLPETLAALDHLHRLRVIAALTRGRQYVSALARQLGLSRPLLYLHLERLEAAGLVTSSLELGADGKAVKYYALEPFDLHVTPDLVVRAVAALGPEAGTTGAPQAPRSPTSRRPRQPNPEETDE